MLAVDIGILGYKPAGVSLGKLWSHCTNAPQCCTWYGTAGMNNTLQQQHACSRTLCWIDNTRTSVSLKCMTSCNLMGSGSLLGVYTLALLCFELDWNVAAYVGTTNAAHYW
jgi:hypothetical protein